MLLYSMLHLAGVKQFDGDGQATDEPAVSLDDIKQLPPVGQPQPGPSRSMATRRASRRRPARSGQGCGNSVGMAIAADWLAARYNRPGLRAVRLQRLRPVQRRRPDGGRRLRGRVAGRAPASCRTSAGSTTTTRSRSRATPTLAFSEDVADAVRGLRLDTCSSRRRQRPGGARHGLRQRSRTDTDRPTLIIVRSVIGCGAPNAAGHGGRPRRAAGRRGDPADQGGLRLARGRAVLRARGGRPSTFARRIGDRGAAARAAWEATFDGVQGGPSRTGGRTRTDVRPASCPRAGTPTCPSSRPTPRASPRRVSGGKVAQRAWPRTCPG